MAHQPEPNVEEVVKTIAAETNTPPETVSRLYADTVAELRAEARVFDYMPLLAARRVRESLRHRETPH